MYQLQAGLAVEYHTVLPSVLLPPSIYDRAYPQYDELRLKPDFSSLLGSLVDGNLLRRVILLYQVRSVCAGWFKHKTQKFISHDCRMQ